MRRLIFSIFVLLIIFTGICAGIATDKRFMKQNEEISADTLVQLLSSGYYIRLDSCTILGRLVYHGRIQQELLIVNSTFDDIIDFSEAIIAGGIGFVNSTFLDTVSFKNSQFGDSSTTKEFASFTHTKFEGPVSFASSKFYIQSSFAYTTFEKNASFINVTFRKRTDFRSTVFEGYAHFEMVKFLSFAGFMNSRFDAKSEYQIDDTRANFGSSYILSVDFSNTKLGKVIMEPDSISMNSFSTFALAKGLSELKFRKKGETLSRLKSYFRLNHYRQAEREITCALKRHDQNWFEEIVFDYTSEYGSNFWRPIKILFWIWLIASVIYSFFLIIAQNSLIISRTEPLGTKIVYKQISVLSKIGFAFFFSLLCTFNIGLRGFNFGRILKLLLKKQTEFRPTGALRPISAFQALLSVFLIGLWILSYFGRPFD